VVQQGSREEPSSNPGDYPGLELYRLHTHPLRSVNRYTGF